MFKKIIVNLPPKNNHAVTDIEHIEAPLDERVDIVEDGPRIQLPTIRIHVVMSFCHHVVNLPILLTAVYTFAELCQRFYCITIEEFLQLDVIPAQNDDLIAESFEQICDPSLRVIVRRLHPNESK